MKYIQNNGRYGIAFEVIVNGKERKVEFDRKRVYLDTGNIATSGLTEIEDDVYDSLCENKRFKKCLENGDLVEVDASEIENADNKNKALEAENKELKAKLKKAESAPSAKQLKEKDAEISSLKAELEALKASAVSAETSEKAEDEGF